MSFPKFKAKMNLTHDKGKSTRKSRTSAGLLTCEETLVATTQELKIKNATRSFSSKGEP